MTGGHDVDVLVVGGGPVGLAASISARMQGLSVAVIEPREPAIDKACGEGLMPGAIPLLARLGVKAPGRPIVGISYRSRTLHVEHRFTDGTGLGVRRTTLSAALSGRADQLGVERHLGRVREVRQDSTGVEANGIRARYLVGADGLHSTVRQLIGVDLGAPADGRRFGLRRHFYVEPWSDFVEVHWTPRIEAYVTPVAEDTVGVAILGAAGTNFDEALAAIPELAHRLAGRRPASSLRGAGPFRQRTRRRSSGRVLLVGDASGYVDAITGEGLRVGLDQAEAAVACIAAGRPGYYERAWRSCTRDFRAITTGLVAAATSPLRGGIVPLAASAPFLFSGIVERLAR